MLDSQLVTGWHSPEISAEAYASVAQVFESHVLASAGGMGFCVYREGEPLLRCYGGRTAPAGADPAQGTGPVRDWDDSTMAILFSGTKGLIATIAAILIDHGKVDPRSTVASYWPEFGAAGKQDVTVGQVLSHTVGLVYPDPEPGADLRYDNHAMASILAAQKPLWQPGTKVAYHALTYGYLLAELFWRITGKEPGQLVRELLAEPWDLDIFLGLPPEQDGRLATIFRSENYAISTFLTDPKRREIVNRMYGDSLLDGADPFNSVAMRRAQMAAGGAIGTPDAMAKLYSLLVSSNQPVVSEAALRTSTTTWAEGVDAVNDRPLRFGLGFELADPLGTYGPVAPAFGHSGAGGGLHGAWPDKNLGFSLVINEMLSENQDHRAKDLLAALARIV